MGSDDTLFPKPLANFLGITVPSPPNLGAALPIGGQQIAFPYARMNLRISDGIQAFKWEAWIGLLDVPLVWPILGIAGFLQFFDATFFGENHEVDLLPNATFPGQVTRRSSAP